MADEQKLRAAQAAGMARGTRGIQHRGERDRQEYEALRRVLEAPDVNPSTRRAAEARLQEILPSPVGNAVRGAAFGFAEGAGTPILTGMLQKMIPDVVDPGIPTWGNIAGRTLGNLAGFTMGLGKFSPAAWIKGAKTLGSAAMRSGAIGAAQGVGGRMEMELQKEGEREMAREMGLPPDPMSAPTPLGSARGLGNVATQALTSALGGRLAAKYANLPPTWGQVGKLGAAGIGEGVAGLSSQLVDSYGLEGAGQIASSLGPQGVATMMLPIAAVGGLGSAFDVARMRKGVTPSPAPRPNAVNVQNPNEIKGVSRRLTPQGSGMGDPAPLTPHEREVEGLKLLEYLRMAELAKDRGEKDLASGVVDPQFGRPFYESEGDVWDLVGLLDATQGLGIDERLGDRVLRKRGGEDMLIARAQEFLPGGRFSGGGLTLPGGEVLRLPADWYPERAPISGRWVMDDGAVAEGHRLFHGNEGQDKVDLVRLANGEIMVIPQARRQQNPNAPQKGTGRPAIEKTPASRNIPLTPESQREALLEVARLLGIDLPGPVNAPPASPAPASPPQVVREMAGLDDTLNQVSRTLRDLEEAGQLPLFDDRDYQIPPFRNRD